MKSAWIDALDEMRRLEAEMPHRWPQELPQETDEDFWWHAQRAELQTRKCVDDLLRSLLDGGEPRPISALLGWMVQRRIEWAGQLLIEAIEKHPFPKQDARTLLEMLLIETWHSDGQHGFHKHAARDGQPPLGSSGDL